MIAVGAACESADRANVDAHAALFARERAFFIWQNHGVHAARAHAERFHVHALIANANAAEAENAARRVVKDKRRPFFFGVMEFFFREAAVIEAVAKRHVLQFAFATLVANRAIERMIRQQEFDHVLSRFVDLIGVSFHDHAVDGDERARRLQLRRFFHFHEAHAASGL